MGLPMENETPNSKVNRLRVELSNAVIDCQERDGDPRFPFPDSGWAKGYPYPYPDPKIDRFFYRGDMQ